MLNLIPDEEVAVIRDSARLDDLGEPIDSQPSREAVRCVVCPGSTSDLGAERPNGVRIAYTLHFPKAYKGDLRGCSVEVRGTRYDVVGDPQRTTEAATPGPWNMAVEVARADG